MRLRQAMIPACPLHSRLAGSALASNSCRLLSLPLPQYRELTMTGQNGYFTVGSHGTEILSWPLTCRYLTQWKNMVDSRFALLWVFSLFLVYLKRTFLFSGSWRVSTIWQLQFHTNFFHSVGDWMLTLPGNQRLFLNSFCSYFEKESH